MVELPARVSHAAVVFEAYVDVFFFFVTVLCPY